VKLRYLWLTIAATIVLVLGYGFAGGFWPFMVSLGIQAAIAIVAIVLIFGVIRIVRLIRR
jgi:hypothetical protein